jgi:hypothetical protein
MLSSFLAREFLNPGGVKVVSQGRQPLESSPVELIDPEGVTAWLSSGHVLVRFICDPFGVAECFWRVLSVQGLTPLANNCRPCGAQATRGPKALSRILPQILGVA